MVYVAISYWLTNQPFDFRFILFVAYAIASSLCAQSLGYFVGASTHVKVSYININEVIKKSEKYLGMK